MFNKMMVLMFALSACFVSAVDKRPLRERLESQKQSQSLLQGNSDAKLPQDSPQGNQLPQQQQSVLDQKRSAKSLQQIADQRLVEKLQKQAESLDEVTKALEESKEQHKRDYQELRERSEEERELLQRVLEGQKEIIESKKVTHANENKILSLGCLTVAIIAGCFVYVIKYCGSQS